MSLNENTISSPNTSTKEEEGRSAAGFLENASKEDLIKQIKKYVVLLQKTKNKCDEMKEKYTNLEEEVKQFKEDSERKHDLDNKIDGTIKKYNQVKEEIECMKMKEDTLKTTIHSLQDEISHLVNENKNLRCNESELESLRSESLAIFHENTILKSEIEKLNSILTENNNENMIIKTEFENLKKMFNSEREEKIEEMNALLADKNRLEVEMNKLLDEKNILKDSLEDLSENQAKDEELDEVLMQLEQVQNENVLLRAELENAVSERDRLLFQEQREESCSVLDQVQKLESELDDSRNKLEGAEFEVEELKAKLEELNENEDVKLELENLRRRENLFLEFLRDCLDSENHENQVENKLNFVKNKFSDLESEVEKLSFQLEDKSVEILELREKLSNVDITIALKDENEKLKNDLDLLLNEFNQLKQIDLKHEQQLSLYEKETTELKIDIENRKKLLEENEENILANENKYQELVEETLKLKNELEVKQKTFECEKVELEKEIECIRKEMEINGEMIAENDGDKNSRVQEMGKEVLDLQSELEKLVEDNSKLTQAMEMRERSFEIEKSELEREIERLKTYLESKCDIISQQEVVKNENIAEMKNEVLDLETKLENLTGENFKLSIEIENKEKIFECEKSKLEKEIKCMKIDLESKCEMISQHEIDFNNGMADVKKEALDLQTKLEDLTEENSKLKIEFDSKMQGFETERSQLKNEIESIKKELEFKHEMFSKHEGDVNLTKELRNEILDLQTKLKVLKEENESLLQRPSVEEFDKIKQFHEEAVDGEKKLTSSLKTELDKTLMDLAKARSQLVDLKAELDLNNTNANATKVIINELNAKVSVLTFEKEKGKTKNDELALEIKRLTESINSISKQLEQEKELHAKASSQLESVQLQIKQQKLVNLEFADYERLVSELNQQIEKSNNEKEKLNEEIKQHEEMLNGLKVQLNQVETQRKQNEERCTKMKILLVKTKKELAELTKRNTESNEIEIQMKTEVEMCKQKIESMQVELAHVIGTNDKLQETMTTMRESHQRTVKALESRIGALQNDLKISKQEYEECKDEYDSYKIRVHSVLKQQKEKSSSVTQQEVDICEKEYLEKALDQLKLRLEEANEQVTALKMEKSTLQDEYDRVVSRHDKVVNELHKHEKELNDRLESLYSDESALKRKHSEALLQLRCQNESIVETYKEQIRTLREEKERVVSDLRLKLATVESEMSKSHHLKILSRDENEVFDIASMERQEGEGSENTEHGSSTPIQYSYDNTPNDFSLEQLLNAKTSSVSTIASHDEFESVEQRLLSSSKKIDHLTELLNESEATNLRLSEQTKVLKEEIRRLERNQEREKHAANMEYLKNVVLKFLTLTDGDERERLVPVLTMMLKLSPQERNELNIIAKGENAKADGDNAGWSNYLPRWSGLV